MNKGEFVKHLATQHGITQEEANKGVSIWAKEQR